MKLLFNGLKHRTGLLLVLAVALVGFLLLINLLEALTSSGPDDLLAATPSDEKYIRLPSGAGMFAFAVAAVAVVLVIVALASPRHWAIVGRIPHPRRSLLIGGIVALLLGGVGLYLVFSGVLNQDIAYGQHQAQRPFVEPRGLAVLAAFFFSLVAVGIIRPRLLLAHLAIWLLISLIFGFFGSPSLAGLKLFNHPAEIASPEAYAAEVEKYRSLQLETDAPVAKGWDVVVPLANGNTALIRETSLMFPPGASAVPSSSSIANPLFTVTGAAHTSLLRNATGDVYENGKWTQLDPFTLPVEPETGIPDVMTAMIEEGLTGRSDMEDGETLMLPSYRTRPELLIQPPAAPESRHIDHISVSPAGEFDRLEPGVLAVSAFPLDIAASGSWRPFSGTFLSGQAVGDYAWRSLAAEFPESALAEAAPVVDPTYYRLPDNLPGRIRNLATEITDGLDSPYEKAKAIEEYLETEYSYSVPERGEQAVEPPPGLDPVEWFLFDHPSGGATSFSSAFAVLARSADVPARVVSGWTITPTADEQTVNGSQAHQWAEIALKDYGWIAFDPTPGEVSPAPSLKDPIVEDGEEGAAQEPPQGREPGLEGESTESGETQSPWEAVALQNLASSTDPEIRAEAAQFLGELGSEPALEGLAKAMFNDPHPLVREAAAAGIALADTDLLAKVLLEHPDALLRMAAATGLGQRGYDRALDPLVEALANDAEPEVRAAVADALGVLGDDGALGPLANALFPNGEVDERVRAAAAAALGELGRPEATVPLSEALASDAGPEVRKAAAAALGALGDDGATEQLALSVLEDDQAEVRTAAANSLGEIQDTSALPSLMQARAGDESAAVRSAASEALDEFPISQLRETLREFGDSSERAAAAELLGERGNASAVPELIEAMSDPDPQVREAATSAVEKLGTLTPLENGGGLLAHSAGVSFVPGTTTQQATELPHVPVFEVRGAAHTDFLRTAVGDRYVNGRWFPEHQSEVQYSLPSDVPDPGPPAQPTVSPTEAFPERITVLPAREEKWIPSGIIPTSPQLKTLSLSGTIYPYSATFASDYSVSEYNWLSAISVFSEAQLNSAKISPSYSHMILAPTEGIPQRVHDLAKQITVGHSTPYQKAKAIERYLRANYVYRLANPSSGGAPPNRDPVDWFLYESREGTCGNFSSAFVVLARSVGLTARVVSGWAIAPTGDDQIVYSDQAHQRAEVAFQGLGWIPFEPTASGGAPERAPKYSEEGGSESQSEKERLDTLAEELSSSEPEVREQARENLEAMDAEVVETENGGSVITRDGEAVGLGVGTTTAQATQPPAILVFVVSGAAHTSYLRSAVGEVYENGAWREPEQVSIGYHRNQSIPHLVRNEIASGSGSFASFPKGRVNSALLAQYDADPAVTFTDTIRLKALPKLGKFPAGVVPTSQFLDSVEANGHFRPFNRTFVLDEATPAYGWVSQAPQFSEAQLSAAAGVSDPTYTQLPDDLPSRIRDLALEITGGHDSQYDKAKALETFISTRYTYRFADGSGRESPPPGRDPVDWFLFDHQEGTCGVFSSVFVVMARSVGIPARVVSGWAIAATGDDQIVYSDQAHQWAEIALEGVGWVVIEATASGGPPSRAQLLKPEPEPEPPPPAPPAETVTAITAWPDEIRRKAEFAIGGTVRTESGSPVSGVKVEIFINETKEHGGTKVGQTTTRNGNFQTEVLLPPSIERGPFQLLAHAIGNEKYIESWSDPDITVYSESGLQLTGPGEVPVDTQAHFRGSLLEDTGSGVENLQLQVTIDGRSLPPQLTGPAGEFSFAQTFPEVGSHTVEVAFEGRDFLLGNSARLELTAVMPTSLTVEYIGQVKVGDDFTIEGFLHDVRGRPMAGQEITIALGDGPERSVFTGGEGEFSSIGYVEDVGEIVVQARFLGEYPVLPSEGSASVVARHLTTLTIAGPGSIIQGEDATFHGRLASGALPGIGPRQVIIEDGQGTTLDSLTTDEEGSFRYNAASFDTTGPLAVTAKFEEQDYLTSSSATVSFIVVAPTVLTVEGPQLAATGETVELKGNLRTEGGQPVSGVPVWVGEAGTQPLLTDADGDFSREFPMEAELGQAEVETTVNIPFGFEGTDHLAPALKNHTITVGVPWLYAESPEPVARGETVVLRGSVFVGNRPLPDQVVTTGRGVQAVTTDTGTFVLRYPVPADSPLGRNELSISSTALSLEAAVPVDIKSTTSLVVAPLGAVRPGREVTLQATLYDDTGTGIAGAVLRTDQGAEATTDGQGVAQVVLTVPDSENLLAVPVTFTYQGDELHTPLTYLAGMAVTPSGFNWLLWVGLPALLAAIVASGYAARRWRAFGFPPVMTLRLRRRQAREKPADKESPVADADVAPEPEPEPIPDPEPTRLTVTFDRPAPDLPNVWGLGEPVRSVITLATENGAGIARLPIDAHPGGGHLLLEADENGNCVFDWTAADLGEYTVSARFSGNDEYLESSDSRNFRVVDFREEIVDLYNSFEEWAEGQVPGISGKTPRELEAMLVASGLPLAYRAVDEIISRFEEADYSEHSIGRRQYELMYRSWHTVVGE